MLREWRHYQITKVVSLDSVPWVLSVLFRREEVGPYVQLVLVQARNLLSMVWVVVQVAGAHLHQVMGAGWLEFCLTSVIKVSVDGYGWC